MAKHTPASQIKWLNCALCSYRCKERGDLKKHQIAKHLPKIPPEVGKFICNHCTFRTTRKANLQKHTLARHTPDEDIVWIACPLCDFKTKRKDQLRSHHIAKHAESTIVTWYHCDLCCYKSKRKDGLRRHLRLKHEIYNPLRQTFRKSVEKTESIRSTVNSKFIHNVNALLR